MICVILNITCLSPVFHCVSLPKVDFASLPGGCCTFYSKQNLNGSYLQSVTTVTWLPTFKTLLLASHGIFSILYFSKTYCHKTFVLNYCSFVWIRRCAVIVSLTVLKSVRRNGMALLWHGIQIFSGNNLRVIKKNFSFLLNNHRKACGPVITPYCGGGGGSLWWCRLPPMIKGPGWSTLVGCPQLLFQCIPHVGVIPFIHRINKSRLLHHNTAP
jgi:hypothetical protein